MVLFIQEFIENSDDFIKKCLKKYIQINKSLNLDYNFSDIENVENFVNSVVINREHKPFLTYKGKQFAYFNLSHSNSVMVALFGNTEVGVDVEYHKKRDYKKIAKRENIQNVITLEMFYNEWTKLEAIVKQKGTGIKDIARQNDTSIAKNINILQDYSIAVVPYDNLMVSILT